MEREVFIRVRGEQRCGGERPEVTELFCEGVLKREEDGWTLTYDEDGGAAGERVRARLRFDGRRAELTREGTVSSSMTFAPGERHTAFYELPVGSLTMEILTDVLREGGGTDELLELCYRIVVNGGEVSGNRLAFRLLPRAEREE